MKTLNSHMQRHVVTTTRRATLKSLTYLLGATGAATLMAGNAQAVAAAYQRRESAPIRAGKVFSAHAMMVLEKVCELVIPATDTPSAADLDVHGFIDNQLFHCHREVEHAQAKFALEQIERAAQASQQVDFLACTLDRQLALLNAVDRGQVPFDQGATNGFLLLKGLIVFGYFTSEVGATRALRYQAIPGGYKGSIPYKSGDRSWGSIARY